METAEETKGRILEAANARFRIYGYGKTTMAEIAKDCDMSAANLYRFFENKKDIAAETATECFKAENRILREVVNRQGISASAKLEEFMAASLEYVIDLLENEPKITELVDGVCRDCGDLLARHTESKVALVAEILAEGNASGEFAIDDVLSTAEMVKHATIIYHHPSLISNCAEQSLRGSVKGMINLLVNGLRKG